MEELVKDVVKETLEAGLALRETPVVVDAPTTLQELVKDVVKETLEAGLVLRETPVVVDAPTTLLPGEYNSTRFSFLLR